mgnify:CR=1 FL=1
MKAADPGRPDAGLFPIKTWRRLIQNCLSHGGAVGLSQYGDPAGAIALRTCTSRISLRGSQSRNQCWLSYSA